MGEKKSSMQAENLLSLHPPPPPSLLFLIVRSFKGVFFGYYPRIEAKGIVGMDSTLPLLRPFETSSDFSNSRMNGNHFTRNTEIGGSFWQKLLGTSYRTSQLPKQNPWSVTGSKVTRWVQSNILCAGCRLLFGKVVPLNLVVLASSPGHTKFLIFTISVRFNSYSTEQAQS